MSEETTRNFWEFMGSFQWPEPEPIFYRLYHNEDGRPVIYTMEDLPGAYIEIDRETYTRASHHVRVHNGRLIVMEPKVTVTLVKPHTDCGTPCDPRDVCVVINANRPHKKWKKTINDID